MILRKPYAILIKFFKLIHIILFVLCVYLMFVLKNNYEFLKQCVSYEGISYYQELAGDKIPTTLFIVAFILLIAGTAILFLMKQKNKPVLYYRVLIIYSIVLFVILILLRNFYSSLKDVKPDLLTISAYRDCSLFIYIITFYFIGVTFIRGFGFDIRKFSFEQDLKELKGLEVTEDDNEEFEVALEFDKDKWISKFRKEKRLLSYYLRENSKILSIISIVIILIGGIWSYLDYTENTKVFKEKEEIEFGNIIYRIDNTYVTNKSKDGTDLKKQFVIVQFACVSNSGEHQINVHSTKLMIGDKEYRPNTQIGSYFSDIGTLYVKQFITKDAKRFIFVFEVDTNLSGDYTLYLFKDLGSNEELIKYGKIKLSPKYFLNDINEEISMGTNTNLSKSFLNNGNINIKDYEIKSKYIVEYEDCKNKGKDNEKCTQYKKSIFSESGNNILRLSYESSDIDIKSLKSYFNLEYNQNGKTKTVSNKEMIYSFSDKEYIYFEVPSYINSDLEISIILNIRDSIYKFIKEENLEG